MFDADDVRITASAWLARSIREAHSISPCLWGVVLDVERTYLLKKRGPGRQGRRGGVAGGRLKHDAEGLPWN